MHRFPHRSYSICLYVYVYIICIEIHSIYVFLIYLCVCLFGYVFVFSINAYMEWCTFREVVIQKNKFHHGSTYMVFDCNGMSTVVFCPDGIKVKDCTADERTRSLLTTVEPC